MPLSIRTKTKRIVKCKVKRFIESGRNCKLNNFFSGYQNRLPIINPSTSNYWPISYNVT